MSILVLILLLAFGGLPIIYLVYRSAITTFFLASPSLLLATWSVFLGLGLVCNATTRFLWLPFWLANFMLLILGIYIAYTRISITRLSAVATAALLSLLLLGPYVIFGFADFPGSWFWDGWTYVAESVSLWSIPLGAVPGADASAINSFGHAIAAASRFIASALLSIMSGVFPPGQDEQSSTGFVLYSGVFAYVSACGFLGVQIFAKPKLQILFMALSGFSGAAFNLVFANNFDHLLALSFGPLLTGMAISFKWRRPAEAALFGASLGALEYVYPELSPVLALPAGVIIAWRIFNERPSLSQVLPSLAVCLVMLLIVIGPNLTHIYHFFVSQARFGLLSSPGSRPGEYSYSLNLCVAGLLVNLNKPTSSCLGSVLDYFREIIALLVIVMGVVGARAITRGSADISWGPPILLFVGIVAALALWLGAFLQYGYGLAKVSSSSWYMVAALVVVGLEEVPHILVTPALIGAYNIFIFINVIDLASFSFGRSIVPFRIVTHAPVAKDKRTAIQVNDTYSWEWANYFLNDLRPVNLGYNQPYFINRAAASLPKLQLPLDVDLLISDTDYDNCFGAPVWAGGPYKAYRIQEPITAILTGEDTPVSGRNLQTPALSLFSKAEIVVTISAMAKSNVSISGELIARDGKPAVAKLLLRSETDQNSVDVNGHFATTLSVPAGESKVELAILPAANGAIGYDVWAIRGLAACAAKD